MNNLLLCSVLLWPFIFEFGIVIAMTLLKSTFKKSKYSFLMIETWLGLIKFKKL